MAKDGRYKMTKKIKHTCSKAQTVSKKKQTSHHLQQSNTKILDYGIL